LRAEVQRSRPECRSGPPAVHCVTARPGARGQHTGKKSKFDSLISDLHSKNVHTGKKSSFDSLVSDLHLKNGGKK